MPSDTQPAAKTEGRKKVLTMKAAAAAKAKGDAAAAAARVDTDPTQKRGPGRPRKHPAVPTTVRSEASQKVM